MRWSLIKLARYLRERGICEISHLGRVLARAGLSFQRRRSWRASPDPDYEAKAQRVLELHERAPTGGAVISFDQMGTISLRPTHGCRWPGGSARSACGRPSNAAGVRYGFGALDVHADRLRLRLEAPRRRLRHAGVHAPGPPLLPARDRAVLDPGQPVGQLDPRREFAAQSNIELVPLPTYASYLNRIEAHFRPITEFVDNNADYLDWDAFAHALAVHVLHRNGCDRDRRIAERERRLMIAA